MFWQPSLHTLFYLHLPVPLPQVHCNNMFSRGVSMFRQASCFFRSGSEWEADPVTFRPTSDRASQIARFVTVPLGDRTASAIKCRFHFADLWMLFSEVAFQSGKSGVGCQHPLCASLCLFDNVSYWKRTLSPTGSKCCLNTSSSSVFPFLQAQQCTIHLWLLACSDTPQTHCQVGN